MTNILYPLDPKKVLTIEGKLYVAAADEGRLMDKEEGFVPFYFVRSIRHKWFPDDPIIGDENWAFRESRMIGPFSSLEEAEKTRKVIEWNDCRDRERYRTGGQIISKAVPEKDCPPTIVKYRRHAVRISVSGMQSSMYSGERIPDKRDKIDDIWDAVERILKERGEAKEDDKGSVRAVMNEAWYIAFRFACLFSFEHGIQIESLGTHEQDPIVQQVGFSSGEFSEWDYDVHQSVEEFVSFASVVFDRECDSLDELVKKSGFIPEKVEPIGKLRNLGTMDWF